MSSTAAAMRATSWTQSMRMMLPSRLTPLPTTLHRTHEKAGEECSQEQRDAAFASFVDALKRKEKEGMMAVVVQHPEVVTAQNEKEQSALHLVCSLLPIYFYEGVIEQIVQVEPESVACMDQVGQTPLHTLCQNTSITDQVLQLVISALPAAVAMRDKGSSLAMHYLCANPAVNLVMLKQLVQDDTLKVRNNFGQTPLHCLLQSHCEIQKAEILFLLDACGACASAVDGKCRTLLHWACDTQGINSEIMEKLVAAAPEAVFMVDSYGDPPLQLLCQNPSIDAAMLKTVLKMHPEAISNRSRNELSPFHDLCENEAITCDLLSTFLDFDKQDTAASAVDKYEATPLHLLCTNEKLVSAMLRLVLLSCGLDSFKQDVYGKTPLHYLCMNPKVEPEMIWLFIERNQNLVRKPDEDGKTPLHHLCSNRFVTQPALEVLYDAWPNSTLIEDNQLRLPIQHLMDNTVANATWISLLVSGPTSFRHRYEFLHHVGERIVKYTQGCEMVYMQVNLAMDTQVFRQVFVKFLSSASAMENERAVWTRLQEMEANCRTRHAEAKYCSVKLVETFDDARRRIILCADESGCKDFEDTPEQSPENSDSSITPIRSRTSSMMLNYGLVFESPECLLTSMGPTAIAKVEDVLSAALKVGACLLFWHAQAFIVHGNVVAENIGLFQDGFCMIPCQASHEFHKRLAVEADSIAVDCCPPEAAHSFLSGEQFVPTSDSDVWQFGCLIFQLATKISLMQAIAPWSQQLSRQHKLHLVCAMTDEVIEKAVSSLDARMQHILTVALRVNPSKRWAMQRIMEKHSNCVSEDTNCVEYKHNSLEDFKSNHCEQEPMCIQDHPSEHHAEEHLAFMKKEQLFLRNQLRCVKTNFREQEEECERLERTVHTLQQQLTAMKKEKNHALENAHAFASNHQSMTQQLHVTMQMLLALVPLARTVYGSSADEFLSYSLAQAAGAQAQPLIGSSSEQQGVGWHASKQTARGARRFKRRVFPTFFARRSSTTLVRHTPAALHDQSHELAVASEPSEISMADIEEDREKQVTDAP